ncbi:MAG: transposase [Gammaproteobacteria bacterium]|nr:transposase [Gammaproteobacteria bacterium]
MSNYRRLKTEGVTYFFTLTTKGRRPWFNREENINLLRQAFKKTMDEHPFEIEAAVILPDHLHSIWRMPTGDNDYSGRWREIKKRVSRHLDTRVNARRERPVWQRRFWEHQIRDEQDWQNHIDYIHYNPVKHQLVKRVIDWPWSSFHQSVAKGWYEPDWGGSEPPNIKGMEYE